MCVQIIPNRLLKTGDVPNLGIHQTSLLFKLSVYTGKPIRVELAQRKG